MEHGSRLVDERPSPGSGGLRRGLAAAEHGPRRKGIEPCSVVWADRLGWPDGLIQKEEKEKGERKELRDPNQSLDFKKRA